RPPSSTLFPYTTLFRSHQRVECFREGYLAVGHGSGRVLAVDERSQDPGDLRQRSRRAVEQELARELRGERLRGELRVFFIGFEVDRKSTRLNSSHLGIS